MESEWIKVFESLEEYQSVLIKELLERNNLHPVMYDRRDDSFLVGDASVYVKQEEFERAKAIIEANRDSEE